MKKQIIRIARFQTVLLTAAVFVAGCVQIPAEPEKIPLPAGNMTGAPRFNAQMPC